MGTHPIFESDFDCLTDSMSASEKEDHWSNKLLSTSGTGIGHGTGRVYPRPRLIAILGVVILVLYVFLGRGDSEVGPKRSYEPNVSDPDIFYAIVFDAGSTGSRIHVNKFTKRTGKLELLYELFEQVKPGLSSFADDVSGGVGTIDRLLDYAKDFIPEEDWSKTPLDLKATAGLRLLPKEKADAIINGVEKLLRDSPFKVGSNAVEIMDGSDEGVFAWMTVNFLLGALGGTGIQNTVPTIDLGGGSMQLTFHPKDSSTISSAPEGFILSRTLFGETFDIYSHSYLGLGLMSAREKLFGGPPPQQNQITQVLSPCFPSGKKIDWSNAGSSYSISGNEGGFQGCLGMAKSAVNKINIDKPKEIINGDVYAFSYYFDKAADAGLIDPETGGKIQVKDFLRAAKKSCSTFDSSNQWLCTDLCLISALLESMGLPEEQNLQIYKKINGGETAWALGDSFQLI